MNQTQEYIFNVLNKMENTIQTLQTNFELLDIKISDLLDNKDSILQLANISNDLIDLNKNKLQLKALSASTRELLTLTTQTNNLTTLSEHTNNLVQLSNNSNKLNLVANTVNENINGNISLDKINIPAIFNGFITIDLKK
jgi:hypothetical protein